MSLQFRRHDFDHFDMSVAKEGKVFDQKKPLQPFLYTHEGIEMGCIIFFFTSSTLTVYSNVHTQIARHNYYLHHIASHFYYWQINSLFC